MCSTTPVFLYLKHRVAMAGRPERTGRQPRSHVRWKSMTRVMTQVTVKSHQIIEVIDKSMTRTTLVGGIKY